MKMGGHTYYESCPDCGKDMECYSDTCHPSVNSKECLYCGTTFLFTKGKLTSKELIERRIDNEFCLEDFELYFNRAKKEERKPMTFEEWTKQCVIAEKI